jgi:hypothetical protein
MDIGGRVRPEMKRQKSWKVAMKYFLGKISFSKRSNTKAYSEQDGGVVPSR